MANSSTLQVIIKEDPGIKETAKRYERASKNNQIQGPQKRKAEGYYDTIKRYQDRTVESLSTKELNDFKSAFKSLVDIVEKATNIKQSKYSQDLKKREQLEVQKQKVLGNIQHTGFTQKIIKDPSFQPGVTQMNSLSLKEVYSRMFKDGGAYGMQKLPQNDLKTLLDDKNGFSRFKSAIEGKSTLISKESMTAVQEVFEKFKTGGEHFSTIWRQGTKEAVKYLNILEEIAKVDKEIKANEKHLSNDDKFANITKDTNKRINEAIEVKQKQLEQEKEAAQQNKETADAVNKSNKSFEKQENTITKAVKKFAIYGVALKLLKSALREAVRTVVELDKSLTEQAMVTGLTREQTYGLIGSYQKLALETGATTKEIAEVSTEYMKQGKTIAETQKLTKAAVSAAKVARVSVGDSVNYLTTALNGFRLSADQAMLVSDKFAAVAAASATDYDELAIALSKVASQANLAGMSIDYTTALLTKGLETTREAPETMGTALKTIIARMRELTDYGKTLEDGISLNNVEEQLKYVGISLRDYNGELRSTEDVLDELGKKWSTLDSNMQAALAKALAGTRQQSRLIALMDNYERVTELQEISQRSAGATAAQAEVYLEGLEASLNKIRVAWESIVQSVANSKIVMGLVNSAAKVMESIADSMKNAASRSTIIISTIGLIVSSIIKKVAQQKVYNRLKQDELEMEKAIHRLKTDSAFKQTAEKAGAVDSAGNVANAGQLVALNGGQLKGAGKWGKFLGGVSKVFGYISTGIQVAALVYGVGQLIKSFIDFRTESEKIIDNMKKLSNESFRASQSMYEIGNAISKFDQLDKKIVKTKEDLKEMNSVLDAAAEKANLSDEEKEKFKKKTAAEKRNFLEEKKNEQKKISQEKRNQIIKEYQNAKDKASLRSNDEYMDGLLAAGRGAIYDKLDSKQLQGTNRSTANELVSILGDSLTHEDADELLLRGGADKMIDAISSESGLEFANQLLSDESSLTEKINALQSLKHVLGENSVAAKALSSAFNDLDELSNLESDVLSWMEDSKISGDDLNKLADSYNAVMKSNEKLNLTQEEYSDILTKEFLPSIARGTDAVTAFKDAFGEGAENADAMLESLQKITGKDMLQAGQSMDQFKNSISSFYETASKWGEMSDTEKTSFISSHAAYFEGEQGKELLASLESGNQKGIKQALMNNKGLEEARKENLKWVEETLELEKAKTAEKRNEAYIAQLEQYQKYLNDKENMFKVSLKVELDQQNKQIEMYKQYLSEEHKAQQDSLNKRKEAYQSYWADLDKMEAAEDYDEKRKMLEDNIAKMSTSSGFDSLSKKQELENELKQIQKERSKELRKEARDSVVENIDDQVTKMNENFEKMINNQQALLELLGKELTNPDAFFGKLMKQAQSKGMTGLQMADKFNEVKNTFRSSLQNYDFDNKMTNSNNNITFNFNGQNFGASSNRDVISWAEKALKETGGMI